uniref:hypothetical protein n=1 Tax=Pedobacter schmidteae TaxID=2201271 RepID=UPI0013CE5AE6|nr:hypothetical protein [Pedobacter schmidteae]
MIMNYLLRSFLMFAVCLLAGCLGMPNLGIVPITGDEEENVVITEKMRLFASNESMALEIYNLADTSAKDVLLYEIRERGIYYWNENLKIIDDIEKMNLPADLKVRMGKLREYCDLRIESYEFFCQVIQKGEKLSQHNEKLLKLNQAVEKVMDELK